MSKIKAGQTKMRIHLDKIDLNKYDVAICDPTSVRTISAEGSFIFKGGYDDLQGC
jgi:hypothetical protein